MFADALSDIRKQRTKVAAPWYWGSLAYVYGRSGQASQARHAIQRLLQLNRQHLIDPSFIAWAYAGLGDKDEAFKWLEEGYTQHSVEFVSLKVNPGYDSMRDDPRFRDLLRRVNLAD
jgi:tetratricopeptide (TPR) repeat protein